MESFLTFFETMPTLYKLIWIFGVLSITSLVEMFDPLFHHDHQKAKHAGVNIFFLFCTMVINTLFSAAVVGVCLWTTNNGIGLLHMIDLPIWLELLLGVMALDFFAQYVAHVSLHKVGFMWRLHMVHHSDTHVTATTGTRHHPGDYVFREIYALAAILITGMPIAFYLFYRILTIPFTYFTHANIDMPSWLDKALSYVFITPHMHKFHHHFERPWTDTNYGNIFSFWDRIFGTLVYDDPKQVVYGLDVADDSKDTSIAYQLGLPFNKDIKTDYMFFKPRGGN